MTAFLVTSVLLLLTDAGYKVHKGDDWIGFACCTGMGCWALYLLATA